MIPTIRGHFLITHSYTHPPSHCINPTFFYKYDFGFTSSTNQTATHPSPCLVIMTVRIEKSVLRPLLVHHQHTNRTVQIKLKTKFLILSNHSLFPFCLNRRSSSCDQPIHPLCSLIHGMPYTCTYPIQYSPPTTVVVSRVCLIFANT